MKDKGIEQTRFNIALQRQILEQDLGPEDAQKLRYAELQRELADLTRYLEFDNGAAFDIGDRLTRPYSQEDYVFLDAVDEFKKIGGDPMIRAIFADEQRLIAPNLNLPLGDKFGSIEKGNIVVKNGGFQARKREWRLKNLANMTNWWPRTTFGVCR